ncbi:MAG TPA: hypothetical protein PKM88_00125 [bacterium]|nr:hypothetical protein [bacterium]
MKNSICLFLVYFAGFLLLGDCQYRVLDEWHYFLLTEAMATRAAITLPVPQFTTIAAPTPDGGPYLPTRFPLGYPLAAVPVYLLLRSIAGGVGFHDLTFLAGSIETANAVISATLLVLLARLLARYFGALRRAAVVAGLFGFGTILLHYARSNFSESLQALLLFAAVMLILTRPVLHERRTGLLFGFCLGWLLLTKSTFLLFIPLLLLWAARRYCTAGRPDYLTPGVPLLLGVIIYGWYNYARTGDWLDFYYPELYTVGVGGTERTVPQNFSDPPWHGLLCYLFSPGKSIFLTSPLLLLSLPGLWWWWRHHRLDAGFLLLLIVAYTMLFACFAGWEGGLCWGPRFLVPLVPLLVLLAAPVFFSPLRFWRWLAGGLAILSLLQQLFIAGTDSMTALSVARPPYGIGRYYPLSLNPYPPLLAQYRRMGQPAPPPPVAFFLRMADPYRPTFWWWSR